MGFVQGGLKKPAFSDITIDPLTGEVITGTKTVPNPYGKTGPLTGDSNRDLGGSDKDLARRKFDFDMGQALWERKRVTDQDKIAADAIKLKTAKYDAMVKAMQTRFDSGDYMKGFEDQLSGLQGLGDDSAAAMNAQLGRSTAALNEGYGAASKLTSGGFDTLDAYLQGNPNDPYANQSFSGGQVGNDLAALLQSQGASNAPVDQQVAATNANLGAGNQQMNNLLGMMSKIAQQSQLSRQGEALSGRNFAASSLAQQQAGGIDRLTDANAGALQQMWNNINQQKMGVSADATQYKNSLLDQLAQLGITPGATTDPVTTDPVTTDPVTTDPVVNAPVMSVPKTTFTNKAGEEVANLGKKAAGYKPPTAAQKNNKPDTPAGVGAHWEWNGAKWVAVKNRN